MIRTTKALALAALVVAGALGATAAQASAANFTVNFKVQNNDTTRSMQRTSTLPAAIIGISDPAATILPGASDPASGNAVYSDALPAFNSQFKEVTITYARADQQSLSTCSFTIRVTKEANVQPYLLHFTSSAASRCTVPSDVRSIDGQFTAQTYVLTWTS